MLDIRFIRENADKVQQSARDHQDESGAADEGHRGLHSDVHRARDDVQPHVFVPGA